MRQATLELVQASKNVLAEYSQQITLRQLYYRLVAALVIENTTASYARLITAMTTAREQGLIDPQVFVDLTRQSRAPNCYDDLETFMRVVENAYTRDPWQTQPSYVEVWVEKEALATVFKPVCEELLTRLVVCRGYISISALVESTLRLREHLDREKQIHVLYFGDHDPSGKDIPRVIRQGLRRWGIRYDISDDLETEDAMERGSSLIQHFRIVALNEDQIEEHDLPPMPAKRTDSRAAGFLERHGDEAVELDALPPNVLSEMIREYITDLIVDPGAWEEEKDREAQDRRKLREFVAQSRSDEG